MTFAEYRCESADMFPDAFGLHTGYHSTSPQSQNTPRAFDQERHVGVLCSPEDDPRKLHAPRA